MNLINQSVTYLLSFKAFVLLPIILFIFSLSFRMKVREGFQACLTIGIGFIGIFVIFDYFVANIGPSIEALIKRLGLHFNVLDVGWPPLASITWSFKLAPVLILITAFVNFILLAFKFTKTVNIDIWNYWHFIFLGALVYNKTDNTIFAILSCVILSVISLKLADWSAEKVNKFSGINGISITTLSTIAYLPLAVLGDKLLDRIPGISKVNVNPDTIKKKAGVLGEPMVIGFILGLLIGIGSGYEVKKILELAFQIAGVIYILPMMCSILAKGLMPISDAMKAFIRKKFPKFGEAYIGVDLAVLIGNSSIMVTGLLLMPFALLFAFILPGINFIPLGDLTNIAGAISIIVVLTRGNIVRSLIISIPILIAKLYVASAMAPLFTDLAHKAKFNFKNYHGSITSFLDGGNVIRFWFLKIFEGNLLALLIIPLGILSLIITRRHLKNEQI